MCGWYMIDATVAATDQTQNQVEEKTLRGHILLQLPPEKRTIVYNGLPESIRVCCLLIVVGMFDDEDDDRSASEKDEQTLDIYSTCLQ